MRRANEDCGRRSSPSPEEAESFMKRTGFSLIEVVAVIAVVGVLVAVLLPGLSH